MASPEREVCNQWISTPTPNPNLSPKSNPNPNPDPNPDPNPSPNPNPNQTCDEWISTLQTSLSILYTKSPLFSQEHILTLTP